MVLLLNCFKVACLAPAETIKSRHKNPIKFTETQGRRWVQIHPPPPPPRKIAFVGIICF